VKASRWSLRKPVPPQQVLTPQSVPEVVEDVYFARQPAFGTGRGSKTVGSFGREATKNMVEQTLARIHRFRDDVRWRVFPDPPTSNDLAGVDLWADPAVDENDYDGFVAEALVVGLPVVATRTAINGMRLEQGRTGLLVPPRDPNEMTHAILAALFKSEVAQAKIQAARQTASKFRSRQRIRILIPLYESLTQQTQ
jgi:glycosyltransferase involved in cell wall biosynthesis